MSNHKLSPPLEEASKQRARDFISAGIGCHALVAINAVGVLSSLIKQGIVREEELDDKEKIPNPIAVRSALLALTLSGVVIKNKGTYRLTSLGRELAEEEGLVAMLFDGYADLLAKGVSIARDEELFPSELIRGAAIAEASIPFGEKTVDPIVIETVQEMRIKGTICDLGCGSADRLIKICKATGLPGLGLDINYEAIEIARELAKSLPLVHIEQADVTQLHGIWEDVQIAMQSFMTHDITPDARCIEMLRSYKTNFPNMRALLLIDIVAPEDDFHSHMPGYDYVHGLLGIETRQYKRTIDLFSAAGYRISREIAIDLPNTYLWVLAPIC